MNPKLQASGRKGGMTKGPTKARPLPSERAHNMALARWRKDSPQSGQGNAREALQAILINAVRGVDKGQAALHNGSCELRSQPASTLVKSESAVDLSGPNARPNNPA